MMGTPQDRLKDAGHRRHHFHQTPVPFGSQISTALPHGGRVTRERRYIAPSAAEFAPQWKIFTRLDPDDNETWQVAVKRGTFLSNSGAGDRFECMKPTTIDGQAFTDPDLVWRDLPNQSSNNEIVLELTVQSDTNLGETIEDTRTTGLFKSYPSWFWYVSAQTIEIDGYTPGYTVGGSTVTQHILLGEVDYDADDKPVVTQHVEGTFSVTYPNIYSSDSQPYLGDYTDFTF